VNVKLIWVKINVLAYCEVEKDNNGNILKVFGTDHDITDAIESKNKLREAHEELKFRVGERTADLQRES